MIGILNFSVGTLASSKHSLCMSQGCRSLQLFERNITSNCIRPWLESWQLSPSKNFSKVGEKIHRSSGIRTHDHCSTSPGPSLLSYSACRCWLLFFAKFIHLASIILTPRQQSITEIQTPRARQQLITEIQTPHQQLPITETLPSPPPPPH